MSNGTTANEAQSQDGRVLGDSEIAALCEVWLLAIERRLDAHIAWEAAKDADSGIKAARLAWEAAYELAHNAETTLRRETKKRVDARNATRAA